MLHTCIHVYSHQLCCPQSCKLRGYLHCDWEPREDVILWILKIHVYIFHLSMYRIFHLLVPSLFVVSNDSGHILCCRFVHMHTKKLMACCICLLGVGRCIYNYCDLYNLVYTLSLHVSQCSKVVRTQNLIVILVLHVEICYHFWSHICYYFYTRV